MAPAVVPPTTAAPPGQGDEWLQSAQRMQERVHGTDSLYNVDFLTAAAIRRELPLIIFFTLTAILSSLAWAHVCRKSAATAEKGLKSVMMWRRISVSQFLGAATAMCFIHASGLCFFLLKVSHEELLRGSFSIVIAHVTRVTSTSLMGVSWLQQGNYSVSGMMSLIAAFAVWIEVGLAAEATHLAFFSFIATLVFDLAIAIPLSHRFLTFELPKVLEALPEDQKNFMGRDLLMAAMERLAPAGGAGKGGKQRGGRGEAKGPGRAKAS